MNKGFSLIEIMVVVGILGILIIAVSSFQANISRYNDYASDSLQNSQSARSLIRVMVKELRSTKQGDDGSYPIAQAGTSSLAFYSDIDSDGLQEKIRYFLATTTNTLQKGVIKPAGLPPAYDPSTEEFSMLVSNIQNGTSTDIFEYYGHSSAIAEETSDIRMVKINIVLSGLYTSQVLLRNLKDNI